MMQQRMISVVLLIGLFFALITMVSGMSDWRLPDREQGYAPQQPIEYSHRLHAGELQMDCLFCHSAAAHSRHAGIPASDVCMKCHQFVTSSFNVMQQALQLQDQADASQDGAEKVTNDASAAESGVVSIDSKQPTVRLEDLEIPSRELKKLYVSLGLDDELQPVEGETPQSIPWVRVHDLPDFVYFSHQAHVTAGVTCQECHGAVETMQRMQQFASLSMGWCVNCHRDATENGIHGQAVHAATHCSVCHY